MRLGRRHYRKKTSKRILLFALIKTTLVEVPEVRIPPILQVPKAMVGMPDKSVTFRVRHQTY